MLLSNVQFLVLVNLPPGLATRVEGKCSNVAKPEGRETAGQKNRPAATHSDNDEKPEGKKIGLSTAFGGG